MEYNHGRRIIFLVAFMTLILGFGIDLYAPAFPAMAKAFATSQQAVQLSIATYFGGYALGMLILGPLSDAFGRRRPLLFGIAFYTLMSLLCVFSPSVSFLLLFRFFQGIGIAAVGMLNRSILSDVFTGEKLAKAMSYYAMSYRLGPIIAPVLGGFLVTYFGWASNFYFLSLYGFVVLIAVFGLFPETHLIRTPLQPKSMFQSYKALLKERHFLGGALCIGMLYSLMIIFNVIGPFFIQGVLGKTPVEYGEIAFLLGVVAFCGMFANRLFLQKVAPRKMIGFGMGSIVVIGVFQVVLAVLFPENLYSFLIPVMLILFSTGLINSNIMSRIMDTSNHGKGVASALVGIIIITCTGVLTALSSFLKSETAMPFAIGFFVVILGCFTTYKLSHVSHK